MVSCFLFPVSHYKSKKDVFKYLKGEITCATAGQTAGNLAITIGRFVFLFFFGAKFFSVFISILFCYRQIFSRVRRILRLFVVWWAK